MADPHVIIIGAGPAGLAAADLLAREGTGVTVLEKEQQVGGLCRTLRCDGYYMDLGGHRFFSKNDEVNQLWSDVLGPDFVEVSRLSRIFYRDRFLHYPLRLGEVLSLFGALGSVAVGASYLKRRVWPLRPETSFRDWVVNRFGDRLYETFFRSYTEKVWGIPCTELGSDWAAQRIRGLSFLAALKDAARWGEGESPKTLIRTFRYPKLGPGQMYEAMASRAERSGATVLLDHEAVAIRSADARVASVTARGPDGTTMEFQGTHFLSSAPLPETIAAWSPAPPADVRDAGSGLRFRSLITVHLVIEGSGLFPDNWVYVHAPEVTAGRVQNYGNWSADMVPEDHSTSLGVEYFCSEGDRLWCMEDDDLAALASREIDRMGLVARPTITLWSVTRAPHAYPVYAGTYRSDVGVVRAFLEGVGNFQPIGRSGLFRYNNMDHSILTGLGAARNILGLSREDVWAVNEEEEFLEA
jgi:protoporphyrinogen oxidase